MEENIENEATKACNAESEDNVVEQISSRVMGLLGEIDDFVSSLQDYTPSIELPAHPRDAPHRLENAVRLIAMARDELSAELCTYNLFGVGNDERNDFIEHLGDPINANQTKSSDQSEIMKSHVDDCIKLGKVRSEMSRVMDSLSHRIKLIKAQETQKSCSDAEDDDAGTKGTGDSGICSFAAEDCAVGREHVQEEGQDVTDLPTIDEMEHSIQATAMDVSKIAEDTKQISEEIDKISALIQKHELASYSAKAGDEEKESADVREKSDFEETEKSDCALAAGVEEGEDNAPGSGVLEAADSSCGESATDDETGPETTTDDEHADQAPMVCKAKLVGMTKPTKILNEHLMKDRVAIEYYQVDSEEERSQGSRYNYRCRVLDMEAKGEGRNRTIAKLHVAINMLSLLVRRQTNGTLPSEITPFTLAQLKRLEPILGAEVENNSIIVLRKECGTLGVKMPSFKTLSYCGPSSEQIVTVQCTALKHTAVGCGLNKRRARRDAADKIVREYFKSSVEQE